MRDTITVSLPKKMLAAMRRDVKAGQYSSLSEFVRKLYRDHEEHKALENLRKSEQEFRDGKGKELRSLEDLM